jgi:hypothetical protein
MTEEVVEMSTKGSRYVCTAELSPRRYVYSYCGMKMINLLKA